ncbi:MAG: alpha-L-fucosidase [Bacteroidaceae bacterium]|nr:alpha-L-fucosidase [Bacteroidaceae bacterium]
MICGNADAARTKVKAPAPFGATPSPRQMAWHDMKFYAFVHFTTTTFRDVEWGYGDAVPDEFQPTKYNPRQWAEVFKAAGMKGVILTAKHHDGFCLWPTKETDYCVANSSWRNGTGDVVGDLSREARRAGLRFGVYLSPWDRHDLRYATPAYIDYYRAQLRELLTNYGPIFEVWEDGANGGDGYYGGLKEKRTIGPGYYDWPNTSFLIHSLQPDVIIWGAGGDARWCGNESGYMPEPNWAVMEVNGTEYWNPAEVDVSIRPGWFYHASEDDRVRSVDNLMQIYYESVGRGANLILNVPPTKEGLIHPTDSATLVAFGKALKREFSHPLKHSAIKSLTASNVRGDDKTYDATRLTDGKRSTYWATDDEVREASVTMMLKSPQPLYALQLSEPIQLGQRIAKFSVEVQTSEGQWQQVATGTTIGPQHIMRLPDMKAQALRVNIESSRACPLMNELVLYLPPKP